MAWRRTPNAAKNLLPLTLTFTSIPAFMLGILLIYVFAFGLRWFPFSGAHDMSIKPGPTLEFIQNVIWHGTLPALAIVLTTMGFWALGMRGMMITTDGEDYMILAQAKALSPHRIFWLYGVRNAILPQITALADGGFVVRGFILGIHRGEIEIQLAGVVWLEGRSLELDDHVAPQAGVIEEEIDVIIFSSYF
jgi:peptide/nickel transport system permease protein